MYGPQVEPQQQFKAQGRILTGTVSSCRFKIVQQFTAITNDFKTWVQKVPQDANISLKIVIYTQPECMKSGKVLIMINYYRAKFFLLMP